MRRQQIRAALVAVFVNASGLVLLAAPAEAAPFTVDTTNDTSDAAAGNGSCADAVGACSLRAAVQEANALAGADVISVPTGTYPLSLGQISVTSDVTVAGTGASRAAVTIDANGLSRIFDVFGAGNLTVRALTLANGKPMGTSGVFPNAGVTGGAIRTATGTTLLADNVVFNNNQAIGASGENPENAFGGAIGGGATVTVLDSLLTNNKATGGNGIRTWPDGGTTPVFPGSAEGSAIAVFGSLTVRRSQFTGNGAKGGDAADFTGPNDHLADEMPGASARGTITTRFDTPTTLDTLEVTGDTSTAGRASSVLSAAYPGRSGAGGGDAYLLLVDHASVTNLRVVNGQAQGGDAGTPSTGGIRGDAGGSGQLVDITPFGPVQAVAVIGGSAAGGDGSDGSDGDLNAFGGSGGAAQALTLGADDGLIATGIEVRGVALTGGNAGNGGAGAGGGGGAPGGDGGGVLGLGITDFTFAASITLVNATVADVAGAAGAVGAGGAGSPPGVAGLTGSVGGLGLTGGAANLTNVTVTNVTSADPSSRGAPLSLFTTGPTNLAHVTTFSNHGGAPQEGMNPVGGVVLVTVPALGVRTVNIESSAIDAADGLLACSEITFDPPFFTQGPFTSDSKYSADSDGSCLFSDPTDVGTLTDMGFAAGLAAPVAAGGVSTKPLGAGSPLVDRRPATCLDASGAPLATDGRGSVRPVNGACDVGAHEKGALAATINQAPAQVDPTNVSPINFKVVFSEPVTGFGNADVSFAGSTPGMGALAAAVTGGPAEYNVAVSGMTGSGQVVASIPANVVDGGNPAATSTDNTVTFVGPSATVTVNQAGAQADPTSASPINFTVQFSVTVLGFDAADPTTAGSTAPGTLVKVVTQTGPTTYNVAVSGMTGAGTVTMSVPAGAVTGGNSASTSGDNTVLFKNGDNTPPTCQIIGVRRAPGTPSGRDEMDVRATDTASGLLSVVQVTMVNGTMATNPVQPFAPGVTQATVTVTKATQGQSTSFSFNATDRAGNVKLCA